MSTRNLTDGDVQAIVKEINNHSCRFSSIEPDDIREAVVFYKNVNRVLCETKSTARKTIVVMIITGAIGIFVAGAIVKLKQTIIP